MLVPELAAQTDPVVKQIDVLLGDDELYRQIQTDLGKTVSPDIDAWAAFYSC